MSGIDVSNATTEKEIHPCASCMEAVTQTFSYFQEQLKKLKREKANLQSEMRILRKALGEQTQDLVEQIKSLEKEIAILKKNSGLS